ncbi:MAG: hypothetical protein OXD54_15100 [Candidatus Poribacteria bacterium]|nr:hypothetical protein [Candidatus Poribacteria bacterium]
MKLLNILTLMIFLAVAITPCLLYAEEYRVRGGKADDFTDSQGRVWHGAQQENQAWGGWIELAPRTAEVANLTADAQTQAEEAGYDVELFYAVSWAQFPATVKYQFVTGNGVFDVTYLVGEHWSPNNRGFDIIIEDEVVEPLYVTPGRDEIDIKTYEGIEVNDGTLDFDFAGNEDTGAGDLNAMFSALEAVKSAGTAVDPKAKLTTTWGALKGNRK